MRDPIVNMTLIRGKGDCQAIMNGVVMEEMEKMSKRHKYEMDILRCELDILRCELEASRSHEYELLAKDLAELRVRLVRPTSFWELFKEKVEIAWCVFIGTLMELGSITYVRDSESDI